MKKSARIRTCRFALAWILLAGAQVICAAEGTLPITSGCEMDYPPFCIVRETSEVDGFSVELLRAALKTMNRDVTFQAGTWDEVRNLLSDGKIQALPLVGRTPEREEFFDFTVPYLTMHGAIVVRMDQTGINDLEDLKGKNVAVMSGDNAEEFLRREDRGINISTTATFTDALRELSEGRHDAVVIQRLVALRLIREAGLKNLRIVDKPITGFRQDFCFAVQEGDRETLALLNEGLALVVADGTYRHLHAKWFAALEMPEKRSIIIGGDHHYPPFEYLDEKGQPAGYNVDLMRAIALAMGLTIEFRLADWVETIEALRDGDIDLIQGMFYTPARDRDFDFSTPHAVNQYISAVHRSGGPPPRTIGELLTQNIAVQTGDAIHDFAAENGLTNLTLVDSQEQALRMVVEQEVDCALVSRLSALHWIQKHGWDELRLSREALISLEYCFAVSEGNRALLALFSEGLRTVEDSGEYRRIYAKWFGVDETKRLDWRIYIRFAALILLPLILLLSAVSLWSWSLRRTVARRTEELRQEVAERQRAGEKIEMLLTESDRARSALLSILEDQKRAEATIRSQTELLHTMLNAIPHPIFYKDTQGRYLGFNRAFEQFYGKTKSELNNTSVFDIAPRELAEIYHQKDLELFGSPGTQIYETKMLDAQGVMHDVVVHKATFNDAGGRVAGLVGTILDISERKRLESALEQKVEERTRALKRIGTEQQTILNSIRAAIIYKDTRNIILRVNRAAGELLGLPESEMEGRSYADLFPEDAVSQIEDDMEIIRTGAPRFGIEQQLSLPSGGTRWMLMDKIPYRDETDTVIGVIVMGIDITNRKEAEQSLRQRSADLRTMVSAMANRELRMIELKEEIERLRKQSPEGTA